MPNDSGKGKRKMLKGIPSVLTPELLKIMMEMGHGDELLICDGNYPKFGCPERCVRMLHKYFRKEA